MERRTDDEPFEDGEGSVFASLGVCDGSEQIRALTPICCGGSQTRVPGNECQCDIPGNSVNEVGERMKGGAVKEERSPEKDAMLEIDVIDVVSYSRSSLVVNVRFEK